MDNCQYEKYRKQLGNEYLPRSADEFQKIKYENPNEYGILKAQSKGMTYYNKAIANEPDITNMVKEIAGKSGMDVSVIEYRIKSRASYLEKIRRKYDPNATEYDVKDILRYTYTAPPNELTVKTIKSIESYAAKGYNTVEIKNYWRDNMNPYNGINTVLRGSDSQAFELQYYTPESFNVKNEEMHKLYEKQSLIQDVKAKSI